MLFLLESTVKMTRDFALRDVGVIITAFTVEAKRVFVGEEGAAVRTLVHWITSSSKLKSVSISGSPSSLKMLLTPMIIK